MQRGVTAGPSCPNVIVSTFDLLFTFINIPLVYRLTLLPSVTYAEKKPANAVAINIKITSIKKWHLATYLTLS